MKNVGNMSSQITLSGYITDDTQLTNGNTTSEDNPNDNPDYNQRKSR
jgi:hypothetical protein